MSKASKKPATDAPIAINKKARHDYFVEETFEAGLALLGWEVKALREGRAQLTESYVIIRDAEAWLLGAHITPLPTASTHVRADPTRTRKLLLHRQQLDRLIGSVERKGYTLVAVEPALAKRQGENGNRPREGQETARQARGQKRPGLGAPASEDHEIRKIIRLKSVNKFT